MTLDGVAELLRDNCSNTLNGVSTSPASRYLRWDKKQPCASIPLINTAAVVTEQFKMQPFSFNWATFYDT
jgi:hypothetical protein